MSRWARIFRVVTTTVLVAAVGAFGTSAPTLAAPSLQSTVFVRLTPSEARQFQRALASLASQGHVALVAEGAPLRTELGTAAVSDLTSEMSLDQAVSKIASAYDYDAQRRGSVFVLTKRYTDIHDLPCVTLEECRRAVDNLSRVLNTFSPDFATSIYTNGPDGRRDAVVSFFQSLSPAQVQAAQNKTLRYGSLSPAQQMLIQNLFLYQYVQMPLEKVNDVIGRLDYAPKSALKLRNGNGYSGLFMEVPNFNAGGVPVLFPLTSGLTPLDQPQPSMIRVPLPPGANPDPSEATTLGKIVAALKPVRGKSPVVDASLADKPVTAAGMDSVSSLDMLNALSALYDLDLEDKNVGRPRLMPQPVLLPTGLKEIDAAVWASLPVSYARALHIAPVDPDTHNASGSPLTPKDFRELMQSMQLPAGFQQEANERLLLAVQPQLKKRGLSARVPVSSLDSNAKAALAISLMTELIATLHDGFSGPPHENVLDCLDDMDQTIIYTVPGEDAQINHQDVPSIYLEGTDPYSGQQVGLGGVRYFSPG